MTSDDQEASGEVAVVVDKVDTAAAVQIAAASKEKLDKMEKLKQGSLFYTETELNTSWVIFKKPLKKIGGTGAESFSGHLIHIMGAKKGV